MSLEYVLWLKEYTDEQINDIYNLLGIAFKNIEEINERLDKLEKQSNPMPKERS